MAFVSASQFIGTNAGRRSNAAIVLATDQQNINGGVGYALRMGIANHVAKEARFLVGDKVDLLIDEEGRRCLIKRDPKGRWSLHTSKSVKASRSRMMLKITFRVGMPSVATTTAIDDYEITPEGILLRMPEEVSFDRNMRTEEDKPVASSIKRLA